jgi:hypothetical protein
MVKRNLTLPYQFVCFTEDTKDIDRSIRCEPLPDLPLQGWWYKLWFLSKDFPLNGTILFLDLDLIVFQNIDRFFNYNNNSFCIIRDFNRSMNSNWDRVNSSVFRYQSAEHANIFDLFWRDRNTNLQRYRGDQDFIFTHLTARCLWPDEWVQSYKWEMRDRRELIKIGNKLNFKKSGSPLIKKDTSIAVFHGDPNIHECIDEWPKLNWR